MKPLREPRANNSQEPRAKSQRRNSVGYSLLASGLLVAMLMLRPAAAWAHGEIEGAGEEKTQRIVKGNSGQYRLELMISPSLPVAGEDTNAELKVVRLLSKPDPLLGSETPVTLMPSLSVIYEGSQKVLDPSVSMHEEGEAGVFGLDGYHFRSSGSFLLRFVIHTGAGEDLISDFPVTVKTNAGALFRLWVNLAIAVLIVGLAGLQLWKVREGGGQRREMIRPIATGAICWAAVFVVMNYFVLDKVLALRKPKVASASAQAVTSNQDGSFTIPMEIQKTLGIELVPARQMPVEQSLTAYGTVQAKPDYIAEVVAPLWGRIEFSKQPLAVGDKVERGQELVRIVLELSQVERAPMEGKQMDIKGSLQKAKDRKDAAQLEYDRAQKLYASNPAFEQDVKWAKEWLDEANDTYEQIVKEDRRMDGVVKFRDPRRTPVMAPITGTITSVDFTPGQLDLNGDFRKLFTIADTSEVWAQGEVFINDVWKLKPGEEVLVYAASSPNRPLAADADEKLTDRPERALKGTIQWIGDTVDAVKRTVPVIVDVPNNSQQLALGGFVRLQFEQSRRKAVAVPESAVVDDGTSKRIYLAEGREKFQPLEVEVGIRRDGWWQVVSGLQEGDQVIARGAGLLGSIRQQSPEGERGSLTAVTSDK